MTSEEPAPGAAEIRRATLYCETCGALTPHRLLRIDRKSPAGAVAGIGRCQECRTTGPFFSGAERSAPVEAIVSSGPRSERLRLDLPAKEQLHQGDLLEVAGGPARLTKLEDRRHRPVREGHAEELSTVWATRSVESTVRVAVIEGDRSRTVRVPVSALPPLAVGASFRLGGAYLSVTALRARGRTWRRIGDAFPAEEVSVLYARRATNPPAGSRRWSTERETPSSRDSASSRRARSRSSPGDRT